MFDPASVLRDTAYIGVGFGVLAFQRAQVERRDLAKRLDGPLSSARTGLEELADTVEDHLKLVEERVEGLTEQLDVVLETLESSLDRVLDDVEGRLPEPARDVVSTTRSAAREASGQLRELVGRARTAA